MTHSLRNKELQEIHRILLDEMPDNIGGDVDIARLMSKIESAIKLTVLDVIGEDEFHKDTSFGGSLPAFATIPMAYRNELRTEQRTKLKDLLSTKEETE